MKKAFVFLSVLAAIVLPASPVAADPVKEIRVNGTTSWPETITVINELHDKWGLPISPEDCRPKETYCLTVRHVNEPGAKYAGLASGTTGNATITINDAFDYPYWGRWYRMHLLYHELGHALGLWEHNTDCRTSMHPTLPACGYWVLGFTPAEHAKLLEEWQ